MKKVIKDYYTNIFSSNVHTTAGFEDIRSKTISLAQNTELMKPFTKEEVKESLFLMSPDKSPGPDGVNPGFYQFFWNIIGDKLSVFCINCLSTASFPEGLNDAFITLVPKKQRLDKVANLRPTTLCNVSYKIMAKVLANCMKSLLKEIV